jgi:hypothetical protein
MRKGGGPRAGTRAESPASMTAGGQIASVAFGERAGGRVGRRGQSTVLS